MRFCRYASGSWRAVPGSSCSARTICFFHASTAVVAAPRYRLAAVAPCRDALRVDDLSLHVEAADEKAVAGVFQVLKDRSRVLPHQDRVRRVVVDAELIADAVLVTDAVQRDPRAGRVRDVVVPGVVGRPSRHRTLLDAIDQPARLRVFEQRHEHRFELGEVLLERQRVVPADEAAHRADAKRLGGLEHAPEEVVLLLPERDVVMQEVVEVRDVRQRDAADFNAA